jgi:hypothetical protein
MLEAHVERGAAERDSAQARVQPPGNRFASHALIDYLPSAPQYFLGIIFDSCNSFGGNKAARQWQDREGRKYK